MKKLNDYESEFHRLIENTDTPEHIKSLLSFFIDSKNRDSEVADFLYETKDDISPELSNVYLFFLKENAPLKWFMLVSTVYEEKIEDSMLYIKSIEQCFKKGFEVEYLDECQKNTSSFQEFQDLIQQKKKNRKEPEPPSEQDVQKPLKPSQSAQQESMYHIENSVLQADNSSLRKLLESNVEELSNLRMELMNLQKKNFSYRRSSLHLEVEVQSLKKENSHLSSLYKLSEKKLASFRKMYHALEAEFDSIKQKYDDMNREKADWQSRYNELLNRYNEIESQYSLLQEQVSSVNFSADQSSEDLSEDFMREMNEEIAQNTEDGMNASEEEIEEEMDYDPSELIPMEPDNQEIKSHRSLLQRLISGFKDREFSKMPIQEQEGRIFIKMLELDFSKDKIKLISNTLKTNKKMKRVELYHLIEKNLSYDQYEKYCNSVSAA
ncbi:MAG: hypothetical protein SO160_02365 [Lachnospiraceae bacterium]|nr:hypothetical protein [Lachnospiraceae bacterium]